MKSDTIDRRVFLSGTAKAGVGLCGLCLCSPLASFAGAEGQSDQKIVLEDRCFCGSKCPDGCTFRRATLEDDLELKRQAWEEWKLEERFGVEFDPEQAFCHGCKTKDKPRGIVVSRCTVRDCAIEKRTECCIDCDELTACDKDLWSRFPEFKKQVIEAQVTYRQQI
jgi:hypothetical protein